MVAIQDKLRAYKQDKFQELTQLDDKGKQQLEEEIV